MRKLRFYLTEDGKLGAPFEEVKKEEKAALMPGAALASLFEDDEDDWGGDAPDVSAEFAKISQGIFTEEEEKLPLTAEFEEQSDGSWSLTRWPRLKRPAYIPAELEGKAVTAIAATAFAPYHIEESRFSALYSSPISFSIFGMRMGKYTVTEDRDEGGPTEVLIPETITHIGEHAFWHCDNLEAVKLPLGVKKLPAGVFGDCRSLKKVELPGELLSIGYMPRPTDQVMPDMGTFAGCHELKELVLPAALQELGAHVFNSCGLVRLTKVQGEEPVSVASTAFDHSAALRWLDMAENRKDVLTSSASSDPASSGISFHGLSVLYEVALPPARDKILAGDRRFGALLRIPADFFAKPVAYFDRLSQEAFRLDFSAQMALSRLCYDGELSAEDRRWYFDLLVKYFDKAAQFYQEKSDEIACERLFDFLQGQPDMTASDMSEILRQAGLLGLSADFIARLIEVRTKRFDTVTGFEDLDLDLDDL